VSEGGAAPAGAAKSSRNLVLRIVAALVLAPLAIALAYAGGWMWASLVTLAAIGLFAEWLMVVGASVHVGAMVSGMIALVVIGVCLAFGWIKAALLFGILGLAWIALLASDKRGWAATGLLYAAAALVGSVLVRQDPANGFLALMFVLLIVWVTDIGGYFAGRGIGGPKLWPRVSPKKTWAGAIGGFGGSLIVAAGFAAFGLGKAGPLLSLGAVLSVASQLGDLFESAVKRRFGVKDSSQLIPGHGGLMDRLDGFVAAIVLASILGFLRRGVDGVGSGLMVW
jgi:phosphatidate cytidylyltransferase